MCPILHIPHDAMVLILQFLEPYDLCSVARTCKVNPFHRTIDLILISHALDADAQRHEQLQSPVATILHSWRTM